MFDFERDRLEGEQFDVIHGRFLLMHLPDPVAVLCTFCRRLTLGGFLLVEDPNTRAWGRPTRQHLAPTCSIG